jgi:hypothetical protein
MPDIYKEIAWDEILHLAKKEPLMILGDAVITVMQITENELERELDKMDKQLQKEEQCKSTTLLSAGMLKNTEQIVT